MHSYPNHIPLPLAEIYRIRDLMEPVEFEIMLGAFPFQNIYENAKDIFTKSMERYIWNELLNNIWLNYLYLISA